MKSHRVKQLFRYDFLTKDETMANPWKTVVFNDCLGMYDWAVGAKFFLHKGVSARVAIQLDADQTFDEMSFTIQRHI